MKKIAVSLLIVILTASLSSCGGKREANQKSAADLPVKVLAIVNDMPITEYDVKQSLKRGVGHAGGGGPDSAQNAVQALVRGELIYQKSLELGLDKNQQYRERLSEAEAQLRAVKRQEMTILFQNYVRSKSEVTDAEARAYFEKNATRIQTKYHIWQIFYRGNNAQIAKDHQDLKSGMPFEKVASRRFPNLPKDIKPPWDIGYLHWSQIPEPWQGVIDRLGIGKVSDIITGPGERFWVIRVVDRIVDPKITFATEKDTVVEVLKKKKSDELYEKMLSEIKTNAKIVFPK